MDRSLARWSLRREAGVEVVMYRPCLSILIVLSTIVMPPGAQAHPQEGVVRHDPGDYVAVATRVQRPPVIDGKLEDPAWRNLPRLGGFTQREPEEGEPTTEGTDVRIVYTPTDLYFAIRCFDAHPEKLRINQLRRDSGMESDDRIEIILDTFHDFRNAYAFRFNPAGTQWDAQIREQGSNINDSWDGIWYIKTRVEEWGWAAEVRIPLATFRFPEEEEQRWGINIQRVIRHKNEDTFWTPVWRGMGKGPMIDGKYRLAFAGTLEGLRGLRQSSRWELKPYLLSGITKQAGGRARDRPDIGLDIRYSLLANLAADLTVNTDFAQVEADQEQINLDRFQLFFPEKREFFLEGLDIFTFGVTELNAPPPFQLFYSRRIGLAETTEGDRFEVPIYGGLKITGKSGPYAFGALAVNSGKATYSGGDLPYSVPANWQGVFRLSRDVLDRSRIGAMWLGADHGIARSRYMAGGIDASLSFFRNTQLYAFYAGSRRGSEKMASAGALNYDWNTDLFGVEISNLYVDEEWGDDLGFVYRKGSWRSRVGLSYSPRPDLRGIRQTVGFCDITYNTLPGGHLESRTINPGVVLLMQNGGQIVGGINFRYEALVEDFELGDVTVAPGIHRWLDGFISVATDPSRRFGINTSFFAGDYYHGKRVSFWPSIRWSPSRYWTGDFILIANRISDDINTFSGEVAATRLTWTPATTVVVKLFAQVNTAGDEGNINFLASWRHRPRSYLYLVFNDSYERNNGTWKGRDRALFLKISMLLIR